MNNESVSVNDHDVNTYTADLHDNQEIIDLQSPNRSSQQGEDESESNIESEKPSMGVARFVTSITPATEQERRIEE